MATRMEDLKGRLTSALAEARSAIDKGDNDEYKKANAKVADVRAQYDAECGYVEAERSMAQTPAPSPIVASSGWGEVRKQMLAAIENRGGKIDISGIERRGITANGNGYGSSGGIIKALVDGGKLRSKVSVFQGRNSVTVVPVFSPHMATPVGTAPGATGTSSDSTAVFAGDPLTLKPWYSTLAVSMGALMSTDIEAELPMIFSEAFGGAIDKGILVGAGSGSDMLGTFIASSSGVPTGSDITATGSGAAPVWADYISMALTLLGLQGDSTSLAIVVNPSVFNTALGVATGSDPNKVEYMTRGTILGIPVILSGHALTTLSSGSYVVVGGYFKHYGLAIAQEIQIDQIKTVGSDNVTFQSFMYMQGKPLIGSSFRRIKTG